MTAQATERIVDALRREGKRVVDRDGTIAAQCPAHDDDHASLSIGPRRDGKGAVIHCHAGCDYRDVLGKLSLSPRDLFDDPALRAVYNGHATYDYPDGRRVHRAPGKKFYQNGNTKGRALFHADRIGDAETVYVAEGEKDVLAIEAAGGVAVCPPQGAGQKNLDRYDWSPLRGKDVVLLADQDAPGRKHAAQVAELLHGIASSVQIKEAAVGKDAADHIAAGKTLDELVPYTPAQQRNTATPQLGRGARSCAVALHRRCGAAQRAAGATDQAVRRVPRRTRSGRGGVVDRRYARLCRRSSVPRGW